MNKKWIKNTKIKTKTKTKYELFGGIWVTNKQWEREREIYLKVISTAQNLPYRDKVQGKKIVLK